MRADDFTWRRFWLETLALVPLLGAWAWWFRAEPPIAASVPIAFAFLTLFDAARRAHSPRLILLGMMGWVLSFTPNPTIAGTVPGFMCLLLLIERAPTARSAVFWISTFGAIAIGVGYNWIAPTVQVFGGLPISVGILAACVFGVIGTIHGWIFAPAYRAMLSRGVRPHPLSVVILFVACESLPIRFFPWLVGYGAVDMPPLMQQAEWGGVPAVSFVVLCLIVPVYEWLRWGFARSGPKARPLAALATFGIGLVCLGWGHLRYGVVAEMEAEAVESMRVGIVQANVGSMSKRDAERGTSARTRSIEAHRKGSEEAAAAGAELIVWPETAITEPVPFWKQSTNKGLVNSQLAVWGYPFLRDIGRDRAFLVGTYEEARTERKTRWGDAGRERGVDRFNDAALRLPGENDAVWSWVRKVELIPFGETMPFGLPSDLLPQEFTMRAAEAPQLPLEFQGKVLVPFLCYEGILPQHVNKATDGRRPDLLVSLTNDSWFGETWEPYQHLNFTRFRAVEHRAPLVRATNTGISAFVGATGDVVSTLGVGEAGVLVHDVPLVEHRRTIFAEFGHRLPWLLYGLSIVALFLSLLRPPRHGALGEPDAK